MVQDVAMNKIFPINKQITQLQTKASLLNATVIENETSLLIIDTLLLPKDSKELLEFCEAKNKPVKYIINTHWHSDHCYGNRFFDCYQPTIIAHDSYLHTIESEKNIISPNRPNIINKKLLRKPHITFSNSLHLPEFNLTISHAPGHSYDSTRIYSHEFDIYWTGDNVLNSDDERIAIPYFYWGDPSKLYLELLDLHKKRPQLIIPGHGNTCDYSKVGNDLIYLHNIMLLHSKVGNSGCEESEILLTDCYPKAAGNKFWVEKMHHFNLDRLNFLATHKEAF